ncbi:MAG TPA: hypothetical protein VG796_12460 [Verrucomicrobiales bacterium]|nr:hypothetical protein [Verrucomicrobiales bacterium]
MPSTPEHYTHPVWPYFVALGVITLLVIIIPIIRARARQRRLDEEARPPEPQLPRGEWHDALTPRK